MIVRVLTARVKPDRVGAFNALARRQVEILRAQPGLEYVKLARRFTERDLEEVILFEEWRDPSALYAWTGGALDLPRLVAGAEEHLAELRIAHYEALDMHPVAEPDQPPVHADVEGHMDVPRSA